MNEWHDQNKRWNSNKNKPVLKVFQKKGLNYPNEFFGIKIFMNVALNTCKKKPLSRFTFLSAYAMRKFGNEWIKQGLNVKSEMF